MTLKEEHSEEVANMVPHVLAQQVEQAEIFPIPESVCNFLWNLIPSDICSVVMTPDPENPIYVWCVIFGFCVDVLWGIVPRLLCGLPPYSEDVANTVPHVVAQQVEQAKPNPIPEFVCNAFSNKDLEDQAVGGICKAVTKLFPSIPFDPDCETVGEELWDSGRALLCPDATEEHHEEVANTVPHVLAQQVEQAKIFPIPEFVCNVLSNRTQEAHAVEGICKRVLDPENPFYLTCVIFGSKLWELVAVLLCPSIKKIVCEIVEVKDVEDEYSSAVCIEVQKLFPSTHFDPDCKTIFDEFWQAGLGLLCDNNDQLATGAKEPAVIVV